MIHYSSKVLSQTVLVISVYKDPVENQHGIVTSEILGNQDNVDGIKINFNTYKIVNNYILK